MTARRRMPFGSGGDAARAAAAPALAELRTELLVLPRDDVVEDHVDMMLFEAQLLSTPRFAKTRAALPKPRRVAVVFLAVCATLASCGLSAAGALPAPLQHITESIARTLGVPEPDHTAPTPHSAASGAKGPAPRPNVVVPETPRPAAQRPAPAAQHPKKTKTAVRPAKHTVPTVSQKAQSVKVPAGKIAKARPTKPVQRVVPKQKKKGPKPSNDSTNTPAGYPDNWRKLAATAATAKLQACAQADALSLQGCPQVATAAGVSPQVDSVHWSLLNASEPDAVVVAQVHPGGKHKGGPVTTVTVYERFQMGATYTEVGGTHPFLAYSGGIGAATMTWNGSFTNVTFATGSAAGHLLPGVTVPPFERPVGAADSALLAVVQAGFSPPADAPSGQWTVTGDPTQGAVVTFDDQQGSYTVAGTYAMTSADGGTASGHYTATLFFDGQNFQILGITGS